MKILIKTSIAVLSLSFTALQATASPGDLQFPPQTSGGHDFNHAPVGQTFTATAADVTAGIYLTDGLSFTNWLATVYPGQIIPGSYPYTISPAVSVRIDLLAGEGTGGALLYSENRTLAAPFSGFVDIDAGAAGVQLAVGGKYTLLLSDVSGQSYPQGVTGWVVPAFTSYSGGSSILQGVLGDDTSDAFTGDNCFEVLDNVITGTDAVITAYAPRSPGFIVINGGVNLYDHLWTTNLNASNTVFLDGLVNWYETGLIVDYVGVRSSQGVILTGLTVKRAVSPLTVSGSLLAGGTQGAAYSCPLTVTVNGGLAPFAIVVEGLPSGLSFDGLVVSGLPAVAGSFTPVISVTDARGNVSSAALSLTISPAPAPSAVTYTIRDESKGKITTVGEGFLMVGRKKLIWNSSTIIKVNSPGGNTSVINGFVKPGQLVQWKGLLNKATNTVLTSKLEIN